MNEIKQNMSDREYMDDILLTSKTLSAMYHYAVQESSTNDVHTNFKNILNDSLDMQHRIFSQMEQKGWYNMQPAPQNEVDQVKQKFTQ